MSMQIPWPVKLAWEKEKRKRNGAATLKKSKARPLDTGKKSFQELLSCLIILLITPLACLPSARTDTARSFLPSCSSHLISTKFCYPSPPTRHGHPDRLHNSIAFCGSLRILAQFHPHRIGRTCFERVEGFAL